MREVTAMCKVQTHEFVTRIQHCKEYGCISLCAGVRLYVRPFCTENFFQTIDSNLFALVYNFTTAIIAFAGIAFCVLVGETGPHCLHYLVTYKVL